MIINEYEPGQGISAHIDCKPCFEDVIYSISLGSSAEMVFSKGDNKIGVLLHPRSAIILSGDARSKWKHEIPARKSDPSPNPVKGKMRTKRSRRISLTFRKVKI